MESPINSFTEWLVPVCPLFRGSTARDCSGPKLRPSLYCGQFVGSWGVATLLIIICQHYWNATGYSYISSMIGRWYWIQEDLQEYQGAVYWHYMQAPSDAVNGIIADSCAANLACSDTGLKIIPSNCLYSHPLHLLCEEVCRCPHPTSEANNIGCRAKSPLSEELFKMCIGVHVW